MTMTHNEVFKRQAIVMNIPLVYEGRELPSKLQAKLMIMRVTYDKAVEAFRAKMQEVAKGLKSKGYDELEAEINKMYTAENKEKAYKEWNGEGEKPAEPTKEELDEAKKIRAEKFDDYEAKKSALLAKLNEAYAQEGETQSDIKVKKFTEEEYAEIIEMIKTEGTIKYTNAHGNVLEIPKVVFFGLIAADLVE